MHVLLQQLKAWKMLHLIWLFKKGVFSKTWPFHCYIYHTWYLQTSSPYDLSWFQLITMGMSIARVRGGSTYGPNWYHKFSLFLGYFWASLGLYQLPGPSFWISASPFYISWIRPCVCLRFIICVATSFDTL